MTQISAQIIADSKNEFGNRITTMVITFPRFILAELNTHRMFSRNSASSRAIPFEKMLKSVEENPFIPIAWQKDHKGMQGTEYWTTDIDKLELEWLQAKNKATFQATTLHDAGVTKQLCNRLLEPFMWHTVIVTATEWENFFALRCPKYSLFYEQIPMEFRSKKDLLAFTKKVEATEFQNSYDNLTNLEWLQINKGQAEIHIMELAEQMWDAMNENTPKELKAGEWHIPFGDKLPIFEYNQLSSNISVEEMVYQGSGEYIKIEDIEKKIKIATAMCARVSYTVVGEKGKELTALERILELKKINQTKSCQGDTINWEKFLEECGEDVVHKELNSYDNGYFPIPKFKNKEPNYENDIKLHDNLALSGHASPFEHCAQAMNNQNRSRNFLGGWKQYREIMNL